jgi:hypothetical protein
MKPHARPLRSLRSLLAAVVLCLPGCHDRESPTEPPFASPTPPPAATLSGTVTDTAGVGFGGVDVLCEGRWALTSANDAALGSFSISNLQAGAATVSVYQGGQQEPTRFPVELKPGPNSATFAVARFQGEPAALSGVVTTTTGRPISGITVSCQGRSAEVASDGSYTLSGLVSGYWGVDFAWDYYDDYGLQITMRPGPNSLNVTLSY